MIGLTTYAEVAHHGIWTESAVFTPSTYTERIASAGGAPVLLPPELSDTNGSQRLRSVMGQIDGLVLIGGEDVCGKSYGREEDEEEHRVEGHNPARDALEIEAARHAWESRLPILAICRGIQVLNVALGGTLITDLPSAGASDQHRPVRGTFNPHRVEFESGSLAHRLLGEEADVPSHHHQAIDRLADDLLVSGRSVDGVVEAAEARDDRAFALGVQWHPEEAEDHTLFAAFLEACRR
jgi:putative glutamine amidotransferase